MCYYTCFCPINLLFLVQINSTIFALCFVFKLKNIYCRLYFELFVFFLSYPFSIRGEENPSWDQASSDHKTPDKRVGTLTTSCDSRIDKKSRTAIGNINSLLNLPLIAAYSQWRETGHLLRRGNAFSTHHYEMLFRMQLQGRNSRKTIWKTNTTSTGCCICENRIEMNCCNWSVECKEHIQQT